MTVLIDIRDLHFAYPGGAKALDGIDLRVSAGEFVAVVGANGSGKSTLGRVLGGLERPSSAGSALVCGHDLTGQRGRLGVRREVGVLFQDPENQFVGANVEEDLAFGPENLGWPPERIRARVEELLLAFDLGPLRKREPHLLSGGQKQRSALAGVLALPRRVLVLDEPTAMLDPAGREEIAAAVRSLRGELTIIYITQEMEEVVLAERVLALREGKVAADVSPQALFADTALVEELSLGLPVSAEVALELSARGLSFPELPLTLDDLAADLRARSGRQ